VTSLKIPGDDLTLNPSPEGEGLNDNFKVPLSFRRGGFRGRGKTKNGGFRG
jgi:hypothetical protein